MHTLWIVLRLFVLGTVMGSFGSVLMLRLAEHVDRRTVKGILFGFSHCPKCKTRLRAKNLIPLVSYFLQKGKCEFCNTPISRIYPTLEIVSGLVFMFTYLGLIDVGTGTLVFWLVMNRLLVLMVVYDFHTYELHVPLRIMAIVVSLLPQFFFHIGNYSLAFYWSLVLGGICLAIYYGAKRYVKKRYHEDAEGFGQGDIMVGFLLGSLMPFVMQFQHLAFGWKSTLQLLVLFFILSSVLGLLFYGINYLLKNHSLDRLKTWSLASLHYHGLKMIPFIPFMIFAFWLLLCRGKGFISFVYS